MSALHDLTEAARKVGCAAEPKLEGLDETAAASAALAELRASGLIAWTVPKRFGGADAQGLCADDTVSVRALCALRDELAWHSGMLDVMFVMQGLGSFPIAVGGSDALRSEVLPAVAKGTRIAAFALTEPDAGSSLGDVSTKAEKHGNSWRLNGHKTFISNAGIAHHYCILARTSGEIGDGKGLSMFYVPSQSRGLETKRFEVIGPHPIGDLFFHDVDVPDAHRLGNVGSGLEIAIATLNRFRTSVAACANGLARRSLDESKARLRARKQFGKPLATFQALRFDIAEMDARLRAAQLLVDEAALACDEDRPATAAIARAKWFATESASWICDRAVQHFGGLGVKKGSVVERTFRDTRALRIYEGSSEIQKLILAKELLG
ncbi:MAG: acyl-CoA dehydrogenase family protein [Planctomycetota bacterium]|nr:acyl-CoA dehydrogenase family protein [Planctomycetota bacterium]